MKKILPSLITSVILFSSASILLALSWVDSSWSSKQLVQTLFILATTHLIFRVVVYAALVNHVQSGRVRYSLSKILNLLHLSIASLFVLRVWLPDSTTLLAAYGFVAAAVAFSVQDLFKNLIGGGVIIMRSIYRVGDRVQVGETHGDVIDIGLLYTTLLEIRAWVAGDQSTGRLVKVPNGKVITSDVFNYTADHSFIWEEIHLPITHESDWKKAEKILVETITEMTDDLSESALKEIKHLQSKYFLSDNNIEPRVFLTITDNWTSLYVRYVVNVQERRIVQDRIMRAIKTKFDKEKKITIASTTTTITVTK